MRFTAPRTALGDLDAEAVAALVSAAADIALVLDSDGTVLDVACNTDEIAREVGDARSWCGRPWAEIVALDSKAKTEEMLRAAEAGQPSAWRHLNLITPAGGTLPVLFCAVRVGNAGRSVAFGRDLRPIASLQQRLVDAQSSLERDYARLRYAETRYRLLFQMSSDPVLVVDAESGRIVEVNPATERIFGSSHRPEVGQEFLSLFSAEGRRAVELLLAGVRTAGRGDEVRATLAFDSRAVDVSASLFRQENTVFFLVRLLAVATGDETAVTVAKQKFKLLKLMESAPDGFVVTGPDGRIITANNAFLEMTQLATEDQARGEPLDRWLGRPGVDLEVLLANLRERGPVRLFPSTLRGEYGAQAEVEISAVAMMDGSTPCFGFAIRDVGPRFAPSQGARSEMPRSVQQLSELIGRVPLKDLVREATDVIERLCIEAALELTNDNRASAAEMLGLSRQSLYVKLRRYGLGDLASGQGST
ncbi:transcriptional regulator PpsR [Elioraea tepida]|uniref:Transcriptional regulator PpsR n=1 Tax=Elioraea tepida TaxID=2843330 RepID=A0A975YK68_9PROT|nr:transcriptional regulator PpsR [Elioraea tepida]QXM25193.1 transcriptional regulator PpsR [Elioraea tepida]